MAEPLDLDGVEFVHAGQLDPLHDALIAELRATRADRLQLMHQVSATQGERNVAEARRADQAEADRDVLSKALSAERLKVAAALEFMDDDAQYALENEHALRRELTNLRKILNG